MLAHGYIRPSISTVRPSKQSLLPHEQTLKRYNITTLYIYIFNMQFLALFVATLVSAAVAAPADQDWQQNQPGKPDQCGQPSKPGNWTNNNDGHNGQWGEKVRVGYTLDLNYNTPLGSLSCSSVFDKKYPRMSPFFHICAGMHL